MELTENYLVSSFGFKRRSKNKNKFLINNEYNIILVKNNDGSFYNEEEKDTYIYDGEIITLLAIKDIDKKSDKFKQGLPEINLNQGCFEQVYQENKQSNDFAFIPHDKAKLLLNAKFNELISSGLMMGGGKEIFSYCIKECKYDFVKNKTSDFITLKLSYHYKDRQGKHDFWNIFDIYNFDKDKFPINSRTNSYISIDYLIKKFT
jgi:hypothetical protein